MRPRVRRSPPGLRQTRRVAVVGVGVDVLDVARMERALARTPALLTRVFTAGEVRACRGRPDRLAARFAAKEAVAKALGTGIRGFAFRDVEVVADPLGRPEVVLHGPAAAVAAARGVARVHLSLSTSAALAVANAVAES